VIGKGTEEKRHRYFDPALHRKSTSIISIDGTSIILTALKWWICSLLKIVGHVYSAIRYFHSTREIARGFGKNMEIPNRPFHKQRALANLLNSIRVPTRGDAVMTVLRRCVIHLLALSFLVVPGLASKSIAQRSDSSATTEVAPPAGSNTPDDVDHGAGGGVVLPGETGMARQMPDIGLLFPEEFRKQKHFVLYDYQWICLLVLIFLGFVADRLVRWVLCTLTKTWLKFTGDKQVETAEWKLWKPLGLLAQVLVWYAGTELLGLPEIVQTVLLYGLKLFAIVAAVWTAFLVIDLIAAYLAKKALGTATKFDDLLVPLVSKSLKVFVLCMGLVTCAQAFNLPIAGLLGGLGIGGAAIAFASKDAIANLFGSVTVLTDRPFEIGDWIKTEGIEGTVESVGFRSSRIRTFYNSLITLPNSRLTTAIVDNMGTRKYRRITATLGVQYDTSPEQIDAFCEAIRELIRRHPYTRKDYYHVYLNGFSDSSLDIMLYCFVECPDWSVELREKHRLFIDIIRLAKGLGISFAFPTRTLHLYQEEHASGTAPVDLAQADRAGQKLAAETAGPLLSVEQRPGGVEFRGPTPME
jgi:small-conductance mechanosensitive channel